MATTGPEGWFTVERVDADTYAVSEYRHWEEPHCYLLLGRERAALIDTGLGVGDIRAVVERLTDLPVTVLTTHVHWDHTGGHGLFEDLAVHEAERDWLDGHFPLPLAVVKGNLTAQPCDFPADFSLDDYKVFQGPPCRVLRDGDVLDLGGRVLTVLHTPGHSPGHCCFYEPERGYLYAGDLLYLGCLDAFYPTTDPVLFWRSVERVEALEVRRILPGHHRLEVLPDLTGRVVEGFRELSRRGELRQGSGVFDFGDFQIHI